MTSANTRPTTRGSDYSAGAVGLTVFAAVLMMMVGILHAVVGVVALLNDEFYVLGVEYLFRFDVTSWGWVHLIVGVVVLCGGLALTKGAAWARTLAVILACASILANFVWLPYQPLWSTIVIALSVLVIWAVTAHGRDVTRA